MEIVQIGAVRLADTPALEEIAALDVIIRPHLNPVLSDYFKELTGITQHQVDETKTTFADALRGLENLFDGVTRVWSFGVDETTLALNCEMNGVPMPFPDDLFDNARRVVEDYVGTVDLTLQIGALPDIMGFPRAGDAHDALGDSRCIAEAFRILRRDGAF